METSKMGMEEKLNKILENQKVLADALEFLVWREWRLSTGNVPEYKEMLRKLRSMNDRKTL